MAKLTNTTNGPLAVMGHLSMAPNGGQCQIEDRVFEAALKNPVIKAWVDTGAIKVSDYTPSEDGEDAPKLQLSSNGDADADAKKAEADKAKADADKADKAKADADADKAKNNAK